MAEQNSNNKLSIFIVFIVVIVAIAAFFVYSDSSRNQEIEVTQDVSRLAYLLLDYRDADYKSTGNSNDNEVIVNFDLGEYSAGNEITFLDEARYVYSKFFKTFKNKNITLVGNAIFTDVKGNKSKGKAFIIEFTPEQSKTINWEDVRYENLPQLADKYWVNPSYQ